MEISTTNEREERCFLLLSMVPGLGIRRIKTLVSMLGSASNVMEASRSDLMAVPGIGPVLAAAIMDTCSHFDLIRFERLLKQEAINYITWFNDSYPEALRQLDSPPPLLFYRGKLEVLTRPMLAVVGTRKPTAPMTTWLENLCAELAEAGVVIVSGLARGIDGAAHRGALRTGMTVAVLGSGLTRIYPPEHRSLAKEIAQNGLVLSEYAPFAQVRAQNFPARNRIISGLSDIVLLAAAGSKSGALITAEFARKQKKRLLAIPGAPYDPSFAGVNRLLADGLAEPVYNAENILQHVRQVVGDSCLKKSERSAEPADCSEDVATPEVGPEQALREGSCRQTRDAFKLGPLVLSALSEPLSAEQLLARTGLEPALLSRVLTDLEVAGEVACSELGLWFRTT